MLSNRRGVTFKKNYSNWVVFFLVPLGILAFLVLYPTYYLWRLAFSNFDITYMEQPVFNGLSNFSQIVSDSYFWAALGNTFIISGFAVLVEFFLGLGMALLLNRNLPGGRILKSLLITPIMIPPVVVGLNFKLIFDNFGPLNSLLRLLGLGGVQWLGTPAMARVSIALADIWQWSPFIFIIFLAGLQVIPQDFYDVAKIEGASGWLMFRYVIWPMLIPSAVVALAFRLIDALKIFDVVYMVTAGGPSFSTEVLSLNIYRTGFRFGSLGYASALAVVLFIILMIATSVMIKGMKLGERLEWD